jgi:hypothetical protein
VFCGGKEVWARYLLLLNLLRLLIVRYWRSASSARCLLGLRSAAAATADHVHPCRVLQALVRPTSCTNVLKG